MLYIVICDKIPTHHFSEISMHPRPSKHFVLLSDPGLGIFIFAKREVRNARQLPWKKWYSAAQLQILAAAVSPCPGYRHQPSGVPSLPSCLSAVSCPCAAATPTYPDMTTL